MNIKTVMAQVEYYNKEHDEACRKLDVQDWPTMVAIQEIHQERIRRLLASHGLTVGKYHAELFKHRRSVSVENALAI